MPRIPQSAAQTIPGVEVTPLALAQGAGAVAPLLQTLTGSAIEFRQARDAAARNAELAGHRRTLQTGLTSLQLELERGGDFANMDANFAAQASGLYGEILEGIEDENVRDAFAVHGTNSLSASASQVMVSSYALEKDDGIAKIDAGLEEYANEIATASTQAQRDALHQAGLDSIDDSAYLTEQQKLKRSSDFVSDESKRRIRRVARADPKTALALVKDHEATPGLTPLEREAEIDSIITDTRVQEAAARARDSERRRKLYANFADRIQGDDNNKIPTRGEIIDADLSAGETKTLLNDLQSIADGFRVPLNEGLADEFFDRIRDPEGENGITSLAELQAEMAPWTSRGLPRTMQRRLEADFENFQKPEVKFNNQQFKIFYDRAKVRIQGGGGLLAPAITGLHADRLFEFKQMVDNERKKMVEEGKNPIGLVTVGHADYLGSLIDTYVPTEAELLDFEISQETATSRAASLTGDVPGSPIQDAVPDVPRWNPGETAEQWLLRDQGNQ